MGCMACSNNLKLSQHTSRVPYEKRKAYYPHIHPIPRIPSGPLRPGRGEPKCRILKLEFPRVRWIVCALERITFGAPPPPRPSLSRSPRRVLVIIIARTAPACTRNTRQSDFKTQLSCGAHVFIKDPPTPYSSRQPYIYPPHHRWWFNRTRARRLRRRHWRII